MQAVDSTIKKIYFYSPGATGDIYKHKGKHLFVNTVPLYLNSHLINHRPDLADQIEWTKIQLLETPVETIGRQIDQLGIDIFCVSVYIWNFYQVMNVVQNIQQHTARKIIIVAGGPSIDPHRDQDFFNKYPKVDYAIFAQGEEAFVSIVDLVVNQKALHALSTKNLYWKSANKIHKSEFQFLRKSSGSPYIDSENILRSIVSDPDYKEFKLYFPYETSKGCAYNCSFCDWTSGLTHKVSHRVENNWEIELDLLGRLGLTNLHISDSNFGQHRQDIEIARTMCRLKTDKGYNFFIIDTNFSKLRKKESFAILDILLEAGIVTSPKFAVQDTNQAVLENADRPDVPWHEHKQYIKASLAKYPEIICQIELIQGLPGQTRDTWEQTLLDVQEFDYRAYPWSMLPNSPAGYDPNYRQKMGLKTMNVCLEGLNDQPQEIVVETFSYNALDYMYFSLLSRIGRTYLGVMQDRKQLFHMIRHSQHLDNTLDTMLDQFSNSKPLSPVIIKFMDMLFEEYTAWPDNVLAARNRVLNKN